MSSVCFLVGRGGGLRSRCAHRLRNDRGFVRGAVGSLRCVGEGLRPSRGRPQGSPLRRGYKEYRGRGDVGIAPYGNACRGGRPCPPGPDNATPCRAGPVCPAGSAGKESPSHGFAVTAPFRQGGLTGYNPKCNTPKTRRQYALESVECSCYQTSTQR